MALGDDGGRMAGVPTAEHWPDRPPGRSSRNSRLESPSASADQDHHQQLRRCFLARSRAGERHYAAGWGASRFGAASQDRGGLMIGPVAQDASSEHRRRRRLAADRRSSARRRSPGRRRRPRGETSVEAAMARGRSTSVPRTVGRLRRISASRNRRRRRHRPRSARIPSRRHPPGSLGSENAVAERSHKVVEAGGNVRMGVQNPPRSPGRRLLTIGRLARCGRQLTGVAVPQACAIRPPMPLRSARFLQAAGFAHQALGKVQ